MYPYKLKIKSVSDTDYIVAKQHRYTSAYHFMYKQVELLTDTNFIAKTKRKYKITTTEYSSLVSEVEAFVDAQTTIRKNKII